MSKQVCASAFSTHGTKSTSSESCAKPVIDGQILSGQIKMRGDEMYRYTGHVLVVAILIRHYHSWNTSHCVSHSMDNIIKLI